MGTRFEVKGLKELQHSLERLQSNARSLHGTHHVPISDVLTNAFIQEHTRHQSVDEWFAASPFTIESQEDFQAIPDAEWDTYVLGGHFKTGHSWTPQNRPPRGSARDRV